MSEVIEWPTSRVRKTFIDFFVEKCGHTFVRSSKVIPYNDPTLKFCNAGMNQFKPIFLGTVDPSSDMAKLTRAANSQKCIRAGGKHNDLEDVGKDSYHHTFFEMLGNWSFGDYFKREAIKWAWELLTVVYGLDPNRLYVTYFGGNVENNLQPDEETRDIWINEIGIPAGRVLPFGMKENFWEMGDTGPCGPCTEIHYDRLGGRDVANLVNYDDPTVIEIWNLVFIQYNREDAKTLKSLPSKHVDTGMGLERVTSILQNKLANYDIDIFKAIFEAIQEVTGCPYPYGGKYDAEDAAQNYRDTAYRVVADHIRTLVIALTDGARPSGTDRGSVIRSILRRAARYGEILGGKAGFFSKLVPVVVSTLKDAFPDLDDPATIEKIQQILLREEESFAHRLVQGTHRFKKAIKGHEAGYVIPGKVAATLQHTDGFPIDLTKRMAEEHGMKVDMEEYAQAIKEHKEISGKKEEEEDSDEVDGKKAHFKLLNVSALSSLCNVHKVGPTDDSAKYTSDTLADSTILAIWNGFDFVSSSDDCPVSRFAVFLDKTNFYAEQGGQTFDTGLITTADNGATFEVSDVRLCGRYVMHVGQLKGREGLVRVGDKVNLQVDYDRRRPVMANHTSTHMINFALLEVIGSHVCQKGSDVLPGSFRFDYAAKGKPQPEQLKEVEDIVNRMIQAQLPVYALEVPKQLAVQINGIRMMEDEDYPDPVRVVCIGTAVEALLADPSNSDWKKFSIEFCGGTHLKNTSESKLFALIKEEALAADVRRVIAVTGEEAQKAFAAADKFAADLAACAQLADFAEMERTLKQLEETLKQVSMPSYRKHEFRNSVKELGNRILEEIKKQKKGKAAQAGDLVQSFVNDAKNSSDPFFVCQVDGFDRKQLADVVRNIAESPEIQRPLAVLVINRNNKKADIMAQAHKDLVARGLDAGAWASEVSKAFGGKGGGKGERGNGNLPSEDNIEAALVLAKELAQQKLSA